MKDLDFDELDKAVNSLMGGVKEKDAADTPHTLDINTTLAPDEKPAYGTLSQVAGQIGSEAIDRQEKTVSLESKVPPATSPQKVESPQKAGRFMDVVHPSSDMKRGTLTKVSREGTTVAPPTAAPSVVPDSQAKPIEPEVAEPLSDTSGNLPASSAPEAMIDEAEVAPVEQTADTPEPLSSPFLPDAKVEKRPLGSEPPTGAPVATPSIEEKTASIAESIAPHLDIDTKQDESSVMDSITNPTKDDEDIAVHVPEEFQNELLAVEKNTDTIPSEQPSDTHLPDEPLATASIPKQYQEKPSTGDTKSGAIFDTDQYHKPLAHPAKKSSGWLWVVAIVVIIALGAGAGAFVYFVGL